MKLDADDWAEDGQHLRRERLGRTEWLAHCSACGTPIEEVWNRPAEDYLCEDCLDLDDPAE